MKDSNVDFVDKIGFDVGADADGSWAGRYIAVRHARAYLTGCCCSDLSDELSVCLIRFAEAVRRVR